MLFAFYFASDLPTIGHVAGVGAQNRRRCMCPIRAGRRLRRNAAQYYTQFVVGTLLAALRFIFSRCGPQFAVCGGVLVVERRNRIRAIFSLNLFDRGIACK
jgi:hypothetical protein